jgi:SET domain
VAACKLPRLVLQSLLLLTVAMATYIQISRAPIETRRSTQNANESLKLLRGHASTTDDQCRFYLAESAIPQSGLGLFTAVDLQEGDQAQSMPDICIYVTDTPDGTHFDTHAWARDVFFGSFEGRHAMAACEGFGSLFNSVRPFMKTSKPVMLQSHDNAGLQRSRDAGAGAVSQYYGISSTATRNVEAGSELTIYYGDWESDRRETYKAPMRTPEWLRKHGMCIDNIRIQTATDPAMGRGAFASRWLKQGTAVAPAPLQLFRDRSAFAQQVPEALFVNYCFAANNMLLFPYGPGVNLINHSSKRPNVDLQWSKHNMNHGQWLDLPLHQLHQMDFPGGLILDVVALRDIQEGEELFLDYGTSWQQAWDEHVRTWKADTATNYVYPQDIDLTQPFKTVTEQQTDSYPDNLATVCWTQNWERDEFTKRKWTRPTSRWPEGMVYCNILQRSQITGSGEYEYEVSLNFDVHQPDLPDKLKYIDTAVPHSAILFVDKPYMSDLHLPNAFRHPIELPKHLIPDQWMTIKS